MNVFEGGMSIRKVTLKGLVIERFFHSLTVKVKEKSCVSEKKIILANQMTVFKSALFIGISKNRRGLIV